MRIRDWGSYVCSSDLTELDAIEVRGEYIPEPMLASPAIITHVSKQALERQGDSTAADALAPVAGISVNQGKYVYVRGLNERYTYALLNNSTSPSHDTPKPVVTPGLFTTHVIGHLQGSRRYSEKRHQE